MENMFINEAINELKTLQDMLRWAVSCFESENIYYGHGTDNPWDEAVQLILPTLFLPIDSLAENIKEAKLTWSERKKIIDNIMLRTKKRIPVPYLTNKSWFCNYEFYIDRRVLIPRSPFGEIINNNFKNIVSHSPKFILDMCTGSGCLAIASAYVFPESQIDAVDISADALAVANININNHFLFHRIKLIHSDLFLHIPIKKYDLIITNPPYVNNEDMRNLPKEYLHEPHIGLLGGNDGLNFINRILFIASDYMNENGILICEVGNNIENLKKKYPNIPFTWIELNNGGKGVFYLTFQQIIDSKQYLIY
ncbi:50S ribosomal protein L3 N(5)-glutamine methyltransferase [Candidatus Tachikawaea gelatinosa]|uniref:50S ribosomal protein L3 glutamine methyltransferase n=1 Tax=Candidatus Tachikawaea gelatinosa TaxID=1410383 RepID=A0A090ARD9_9ENTR|nr:50S ribosomal protein L3 N(5)-glutamine methyltransferase [Candidatus Tachikawaea gelatinosa]BAP58330.1 50S ribosomal protein L3 glutamine methyltransferase [Candidatus Tachikawaea gelatinosa]